LAAAGEADLPGLVIGDAEIQEARLAVADHFQRLGYDRPFDAAARDRADHGTLVVDRELGADRPGRGTPGGDNCRQRHTRARLAPTRRLIEDFRRIAHAALSIFVIPAAKAGTQGFPSLAPGSPLLRGRRIGLSAGFPDTCSRGDGNL